MALADDQRAALCRTYHDDMMARLDALEKTAKDHEERIQKLEGGKLDEISPPSPPILVQP